MTKFWQRVKEKHEKAAKDNNQINPRKISMLTRRFGRISVAVMKWVGD